MKYLGGLGLICAMVLSYLGYHSISTAISESLVITQLQTGAPGASKQEFVEIRNISSVTVDVTNWCIAYSDYKDESFSILKCFTKPDGVDRLEVGAGAYIVISSQTFPSTPGITTEIFQNSSTDISGARGHVKLLRGDGTVVDVVAWDNKASTPPMHPEAVAAMAPASGKVMARFADPIVDTDNNFLDFREQVPIIRSSQIIEYVRPAEVVDFCQMDGIQTTLPEGYDYDEAGNCEPLSADLCPNLNKIQIALPAGTLRDEEGSCIQDLCQNIPELQKLTPQGYRQENGTCIKIEDRPLLITEVLPNVSGTDAGNEYIELYNPNDDDITLDGYMLKIGKIFEKQFELRELTTTFIQAKSYLIVRDSDLGFSLLNTTSGVQVVAPAGNITSETIYVDPEDDMAWAKIDDVWQFTDTPTPATNNISSLYVVSPTVLLSASLAPCSPGKYRHPVTNRCRNIESDIAVLASCDEDEYRSPETNRCRKITSLAAATLAACEEGYERNAQTNRCRKILAASVSQSTCAAGYERNPDTNRCRKAASTTTSTFITDDKKGASLNTWAVLGMVLTATGYGLYEWRKEFASVASWLVAKAKTAL